MSKHATNRRGERENGRLFRSSRRRDAYFRKLKEDKLNKREKNKMSKMGNYVVGLQEQPTYINCPECDGEGRCEYEREVPMSNSNPYGYLEDYWADCENCNGAGRVERDDDE